MNQRWVLADRPTSNKVLGSVELQESPMPVATGSQVVVENRYISIEPANLGWIKNDGYYPAVDIGEPVRAFGFGVVVESHNPQLPTGTRVCGLLGWQQYCLAQFSERAMGQGSEGSLMGVIPDFCSDEDAAVLYNSAYAAAYAGLVHVAHIEPGQTVVVTGANGAVGRFVGQIAKHVGCRVIGLVRSQEKAEEIRNHFGYDDAFDISESSRGVARKIRKMTEGTGVNVVFDNTGGPILDGLTSSLSIHGRIILCGAGALYDDVTAPYLTGKGAMTLIYKRASLHAILAADWISHLDDAVKEGVAGLRQGWLHVPYRVVRGLEMAPAELDALYSRTNKDRVLIAP